MKNILDKVLPKKVYVGKNPYCQSICLDEETFEYVVSNETPKMISVSEKNFLTLEDFYSWVKIINNYINLLEKKFTLLEKLLEIGQYINKEFNYNYLPEISLEVDVIF